MATKYLERKGVTKLHLFNKIWRVGRLNRKIGKEPHVVFYSPEDKEYHAYGDDALDMFGMMNEEYEYYAGRHETLNRAKAKIWVLTHVMDEIENWNFDMKTKPEAGSCIKVIYENSTIKWIESFTGDWADHGNPKKGRKMTGLNPEWQAKFNQNPKDGEERPSQYLWEDEITYIPVVAWRKQEYKDGNITFR